MSTALVTGGARRIGAATVRELAANGHAIVIHYHESGEEAAALCDELRAAGTDAWVLQSDLESASDGLIERAAKVADAPIDWLVNNASIYPRDTLESATAKALEAAMRVHAWAPLNLSRQLAAQANLNAGAAVVNLLDTRLADLDAQHLSYHLSKAALAEVTQATARLLAPRVRVNAVAPGPILEPVGSQDGGYLARVAPLMPLKMTPGAEDVARAIRFLLEAPGTTGEVLRVDAGRHLGRPLEDPDHNA